MFVCLFGWFSFIWARGTRELLECGCVSVLRWAISLFFAPLIYVLHSGQESLIFHLHHHYFSWPPVMFVPPSFLIALPLPRTFFFLVSSWVKGEAAYGGGRSATEASQKAHSGHCVRARNNIYRSPLWAPWKQSQY